MRGPKSDVLEQSTVCSTWKKNVKQVLFTEEQIQRRVRAMAEEISKGTERCWVY